MTIDKNIKRPILRYHGGKWKLAEWIVSKFPDHRIYVELFGGAGSVLMRKERSYSEVYNDVWDTVVNVFKVLRDSEKANELERLLRLTPFSRTEFLAAGGDFLTLEGSDVERARKTILRSFAGFGSASTNGKYPTGFRANSNRSGTIPAKDWANYPDNIKSFVERLSGVVIENKDYRKVIDQHDTESTLFYADPPYVHATRRITSSNHAYEFELYDTDQVELCEKLKSVKGMVVLSGYENDIYNTLLPDWTKFTKETLADGARKRTEVLWLSPNTIDKLIDL